jgi:hypothetical protein
MKKIFLFCIMITVSFYFSGARAEVIILTSDQQLYDLMDPDKKIDMSLGYASSMRSLREVCENGKKHGHKELTVAFDEFFRQYRPQAGTERRLTPDMDEYVDMIKYISDFAKKYGMSLCLSLLSPLELGPAYKNQTGEAGRWLGYKTGVRNPSDGKFSLSIWQQLFWTNNKGKFRISLKSVKAYAFRERPLQDSPYIAVSPDDIIEIGDVKYEAGDTVDVNGKGGGILNSPDDMIYPVRNLRVYYDGPKQLDGYDRVMVLLEYETPEVDYFSPKAPGFLKGLIDKYKQKGVNLTSFYSDEMHIQQDWIYFSHHEGGQFATRYLSPGFSDTYEKKYGQPLDDKYMLYFVYGAPYYRATADAVRNVQYVLGDTPEAIHRTFLLRDRYYKMLNHGVVDLFKDAREHAEKLFQREMPTGAHASWAESPTIDLWDYEKLHANAYRYEYTSNFVWSNTVHQASAACYDYFKWGEYLQPTGNDFAECGWNDRDYYGAALAASIGVVNKYPNAYAAAWGMPDQVLERRMAINYAFGAQPPMPVATITGGVHRDVDVLILYPMSLVAAEERFGSWMNQYGYANYLTAEKLMQSGEVLPSGRIKVKEKTYGTLVAMFEPLPEKGLLDMMERFVENGGKVVWFSAPPLLNSAGEDCTAQWQRMFGVQYKHDRFMGEIAAGREISFCNRFAAVPQQTILTDFLVDRIYPVEISGGQAIANCDDKTVGAMTAKGKGTFYYLGFRPRDDQSQSLGYETRTMFEVLGAAGAYPATGRFPGVNDNPSHVSRTSDYFVTTFPNTATMIVRHYRTHPESWEGGFSRNAGKDAEALAKNPLPSDRVELNGAKINGHEISYQGRLWLAFRTDAQNRLTAFIGSECNAVTLDGATYTFADKPLDKVIFIPEAEGASTYKVQIAGEGRVSLPLPLKRRKSAVRLGKKSVKSEVVGGKLVLNIDASLSGQWLTVEI